ncbi:hypothetical protein PHLGIDRAFT_434674 [Phlebiopsis gigantea 11061_1 CR5-6]|uniref:Uncharacterized protein n=1 Tax=Phlebiopsis gigantea (strain 11061_1 CR5-6) TaxID=745531 RepID=A0A0C3S7T1_PHLG1|nr:hypothetical protein PHLGIDRAFT_434674 [Phlebiopsis gigantea 11061_1 CR5-6]
MIVDRKDAIPEQTIRMQYDAPQGPPPGYHESASNPFADPAARGYPPSPNYNTYNSSPGGEAPAFYGQQPALAHGSYNQHLSPGPSSSQPRTPSPSGSSSGFFAKSASLESLLNPPPPAFARAPQAQFPYSPPFATHDVNEEDWTRFLGDLQKIGALSPMNRIVSNVAPLAMGIGFLPGLLVTRAFESRMKTNKAGPASQLVEYWNSHYFHPRMMDVALVQGQTVYGSAAGLPPQMAQQGSSRSRGDYDSDSSSSSSSSDDDRRHSRSRGSRRSERRAERRERRQERREMKRGRRSEGRAGKTDKKEPWRLVVSYRPSQMM